MSVTLDREVKTKTRDKCFHVKRQGIRFILEEEEIPTFGEITKKGIFIHIPAEIYHNDGTVEDVSRVYKTYCPKIVSENKTICMGACTSDACRTNFCEFDPLSCSAINPKVSKYTPPEPRTKYPDDFRPTI